eukprot:TRINITY_DN7395_c0_g1_i2.p1 TRINITY_DN7395_c0_g1~~TRINITY_DN7395_c0_g1_i2.p1  ORF type:complete len:112 (+),score=14.92 TRINITY_DN7395_c0_g1_i2:37-372(+)
MADATKQWLKDRFESIKASHPRVPYNPRFVNWAVQRECYESYISYRVCAGGAFEGKIAPEQCDSVMGKTLALCPIKWIAKWDEGVLAGTTSPLQVRSSIKAALEQELEKTG